jgi:dTDP-glucose 4,6-dehydratase
LVLDKLTYAGSLANLAEVASSPRYRLVRADVGDAPAAAALLADFAPDVVLNLAAESHVDRSIGGPGAFVGTNVVGAYVLLEEVRRYWMGLTPERRAAFRFVQVSTDEVFGHLGETGRFDEASPYAPRSPYAATKAAADHLAMAWWHTFGLPVIVSRSSNNYGPRQYPEKLIPVAILNALRGEPVPVYGDGRNVRDWIHVDDHARALLLVATRGRPGEGYNIGGGDERRNIDLVRAICGVLDELRPGSPQVPHASLIRFVADRPGHDFRYATDAAKAAHELGWQPRVGFGEGLRATVRWYLDNPGWWGPLGGGA